MARIAIWMIGGLLFAAYVALVAWPLMVRDFSYVARW